MHYSVRPDENHHITLTLDEITLLATLDVRYESRDSGSGSETAIGTFTKEGSALTITFTKHITHWWDFPMHGGSRDTEQEIYYKTTLCIGTSITVTDAPPALGIQLPITLVQTQEPQG